MQEMATCLWFDGRAEEAARFYTSVFKDSRLGSITRYGKEGQDVHGREPGSVMTVDFEINGQRFLALNGGPLFKFTEAISFQIFCETQKDIDYYWESLTEGGDPKAQQCGWLKDRFGLSWQVVPAVLSKMMQDQDPQKAERVMKAFLPMRKFDIAALTRAYEGR